MPKRKAQPRFNLVGALLLVGAVVACIYAVFPASSLSLEALRGRPPARRYPDAIPNIQRLEGWLPHWANQRDLALTATKAGFTDLLFFNGSVAADGTVRLEAPARLRSAIEATRAKPVRRWLTVTNHGASLAAALAPAHRTAHVKDLIGLWRESGCDHLDLDYEGINLAQAQSLKDLIPSLGQALVAENPQARLSVTLQPVDANIRPDQVPVYRAMLDTPELVTMRLMCYDSHWATSLPGAHYPFEAFDRLLLTYSAHREKISLALPLYGYAWPRPENADLVRAKVLTMEKGTPPDAREIWVEREQESAFRWTNPEGVAHFSSLPTAYGLELRVKQMLRMGVGAVAFWHLGCLHPQQVRQIADQSDTTSFSPPPTSVAAWDDLLQPWKRRVCTVYAASAGDTFESIAETTGIPRAVLIRFNEDLYGKNLDGQEVLIPL